MQPGIVGHIPDKVVPVPTLYPVAPSATEERVHFSCKKVGEAVDPNRKRDGLQDGFALRLEPTRGIHVHLEPDLQLLLGMKAPEQSTIRFDENHLFQRVRLDESGFDGALLTLVCRLERHLEAEACQLPLQRGTISAEREIALRHEQRKTQIFGIPVESVQDTERATSVKRSPFKELAAPKSKQGQLLEDLPKCGNVFFNRVAGVTLEHALNRRIHGPVPSAWQR